jgi:8-oxo-dGTP pyrophosphatase MutT (NUDIX family)
VNIDMTLVRRGIAEGEARRIELDGLDRWAAVAVVLRQRKGEIEVLLIRRAEREGDRWSGQMAFPGGQAEPQDGDLLATAHRETREEVGLDLALSCELIGRLDDVQATARGRLTSLGITPFVFELGEQTPVLSTGPEATEALWAPLNRMHSGAIDTVKRYWVEGMQFRLPAYDVEGRVVWGITYRILQDLFARVGGSPGEP